MAKYDAKRAVVQWELRAEQLIASITILSAALDTERSRLIPDEKLMKRLAWDISRTSRAYSAHLGKKPPRAKAPRHPSLGH
jgi:hypothetical protein